MTERKARAEVAREIPVRIPVEGIDNGVGKNRGDISGCTVIC
jgi:hypothetical protein